MRLTLTYDTKELMALLVNDIQQKFAAFELQRDNIVVSEIGAGGATIVVETEGVRASAPINPTPQVTSPAPETPLPAAPTPPDAPVYVDPVARMTADDPRDRVPDLPQAPTPHAGLHDPHMPWRRS